MIISWTSNLKDPAEKERFEKHIKSAKAVLDRQSEIINDRLKAIELVENGIEIYKQPGWEALLVKYNTERATLKWVLNLITLDHKETQ